MLRNITSIEVKKKKDDKELVYQLLCDNQSTLGELFDVLCEMRGYVAQRIQSIQQADESKQASSVENVEIEDPKEPEESSS